ncbi:hypothetical protein F4777DRAFT_99666 [Nemania sp. FL0916]|nr:hypothetical protein F4777DRAFT_99666 [Nemania sp. FL0916]
MLNQRCALVRLVYPRLARGVLLILPSMHCLAFCTCGVRHRCAGSGYTTYPTAGWYQTIHSFVRYTFQRMYIRIAAFISCIHVGFVLNEYRQKLKRNTLPHVKCSYAARTGNGIEDLLITGGADITADKSTRGNGYAKESCGVRGEGRTRLGVTIFVGNACVSCIASGGRSKEPRRLTAGSNSQPTSERGGRRANLFAKGPCGMWHCQGYLFSTQDRRTIHVGPRLLSPLDS